MQAGKKKYRKELLNTSLLMKEYKKLTMAIKPFILSVNKL